MQPIKLVINGINSFKTEQTIDFKKLGDSFFGIFGATGSGKSTILDAITLALYGRIARARLSNDFINVSSERASVRFCFEALQAGKTNEFLIERNFKRKKDFKVDSTAVLYQKIGEEFKVVAEGVFDCDANIKKIMGMGLDEFSKCIALPQGQFADFIKSTPNERTGLISNVFSLQGFGAPIYDQARAKEQALRVDIAEISGQISGIGEVSAEVLSDARTELEKRNENMRQIAEELRVDGLKFDECRQVYYKQMQLESAQKRALELEEKTDEMVALSNKFNKMKSAVPLLDELDEVTQLSVEKIKLLATFNEAQNDFAKISKDFQEAKAEYDALNSTFAEDYQQVLTQISVLEKLKNTETELNNKRAEIENIKVEIGKDEKQKNILVEQVKNLKTELAETQNKIGKIQGEIKELKVDNSLVLQIKKGVNMQSQIEVLNKVADGFEMLENSLRNQKKQLQNSLDLAENELLTMRQNLREEMSMFDGSIATVINNLVDANGQVLKLENVKNELEIIDALIESFKKTNSAKEQKILQVEAEISAFESALKVAQSDYKNAQKEFEKISEKRDEGLVDYGVFMLYKNAKVGENCPLCDNVIKGVCGKDFAQEVSESQTQDALKKVLDAQQKLQKTESEISIKRAEYDEIKLTVEFENSQIKLLAQKRDTVLSNAVSPYEDESLDTKLIKAQKSSAQIADILRKIDESQGKIDVSITKVAQCRAQLEQLEKNINDVEVQSKKIYELKNERKQVVLNLENRLGGQSILAISDIVETNEKKLAQAQENLNNLLIKSQKLELEIGVNGAKINEIDYALSFKNQNLETASSEIKNMALEIESIDSAGVGIEKLITDTKNELENKKQTFAELEKRKTQLQSKMLGAEGELKLNTAKLKEKQEQFETKNAKFNEKLASFGFDDVKTLKTFNSTQAERDEIEEKLNEFNSSKSLVKAEIEHLKNELVGVNVNTEEIADIEQRIESNKAVSAELSIEIGRIMANIAQLEEKLVLKNQLLEKLDVLNKDLDYALVLVRLLRGKALAQFVCDEYLEEITLRANQIAQLLLDGKFTLRFSNGEFFVDDNLNGGLTRAVATLSGGETFLISLALALSISETIAVASGKDMDFFFLDEGFGTLDNELCEAVVSALYKLESKNLKIGVISHIKELFERIKNKVIVTKTEEAGSVIKLDFTL